MRAAIIGVGQPPGAEPEAPHLMGVGHIHARVYTELGCDVVAAVSRSAANRDAFRAAYPGANVYANYHAMLCMERPDLVSVCAYVDTRAAMVIAAAQAGVGGIWAEKPLCLTAPSGRAMLDACERAGTYLVVNHYRRYLHTFALGRRLIADRAIGEPLEIFATLAGWDLMEMGSHWFDLFRHLLGDPRGEWVLGQVECTGARMAYGHPMEEAAVAKVGFEGGATGTLVAVPEADDSHTIRVVGTDGILVIARDGIRIINLDGARDYATESDLDDPRGGDDVESYRLVAEQLLKWMDGAPEPLVSGRNIFESAELYLGAYQSALRGQRMTIPLEDTYRFPLEEIAARRR